MNSLRLSTYALLFSSQFWSITNSSAEVLMLDDTALSDLTGQAGLTIDTSYYSTATEFEYVDQQFFNLPGIRIEGHGNDSSSENPFYTDQLDNMRVNVSVADNSIENTSEDYSFGFSEWKNMAKMYLSEGNQASNNEFLSLANGIDATRDQLVVDEKRRYEDSSGDLIIHMDYLDPWEKDGGIDAYQEGSGLSGIDFENATYEQAEDLISTSVDFKYTINEIELGYGTSMAGAASMHPVRNLDSQRRDLGDSSDHKSTRMVSNFSMEGYLGPHDLHIKAYENSENNHSTEIRETGITWNSYFTVTDLDVYLDLKGMQISNLQIHNNRGDLSGLNLDTEDNSVGNSSFGFAHAMREIYSFTDTYADPLRDEDEDDEKKKKKGIQFNTRFKGDIDIEHVSFGDTGTSIGSFFITDMYFNSRLRIIHR